MKHIGEQQERSMLPLPRRLISYGSKPGGASMAWWGSPYRCTVMNCPPQSISGSGFSGKKPRLREKSFFGRFANLFPLPKFNEAGENLLVIHPKPPPPVALLLAAPVFYPLLSSR